MKAKVVIVGGGVAALESALILRDLAGDRASVEIHSARSDFVYRPEDRRLSCGFQAMGTAGFEPATSRV